jgi:hypothetical protein
MPRSDAHGQSAPDTVEERIVMAFETAAKLEE